MKLKVQRKQFRRVPAPRKPDRPSNRPRIERLEDRWLMNAGDLDLSFDTDGKQTSPIGLLTDEARAVAIQADGKIVLAGRSNNGTNYDFALARYNTNGSLDTSFDSDGKVTTAISTSNDEVYAIAIQPDGKIVVAGRSLGATYDFAVTRYEGNYTPVATGESCSVLEDNPLSVAVVDLLLTSGGI